MTKYYNSFRGQTVGTSISSANSLASGSTITPRYGSADPLTLVYDDAHVLQDGYRSVRTGTGTDLMYMLLKFNGDESMSVTAKYAVYFPTNFQFNPANTNVMQMQYNGGLNAGVLFLLANGQLQFNTMNTVGVWKSAAPIVLGHWYTFELFTVVGVTTNDGRIDFQYFIDDSQVPVEPPYRLYTARTNVDPAGINSLAGGKIGTTTVPQVMYVGPMYVNSRATGLEGAFPPPAWSQWTGATELPLSFGVPFTSVNQATNPGYEIGGNSITTGSSNAYPMSTDTISPIAGTKSAMFTRAGTLSSTIAQVLCSTAVSTSKIPVTVGQPITGGLSVKTDVANTRIWTRWYWYDSGGALTVGTATDRVLNAVAGQVYRVVDTDTPPAGTVTAWLNVYVSTMSGNAAVGQRVWADQLTLEYGTTDGSYFDGDTPDTPSRHYDWVGAFNASASTATALLTNQATNPGYELGGYCFSSNDGSKYPVTADTTQPIAGTRSAMSTRTATSPSAALASMYFSAGAGNPKFLVTPGQAVTISLSIKTDTAGMNIVLGLYWYDSSNALIGNAGVPVAVAGTVAGQVYRISRTVTPPANAAGSWGNLSVATPDASNAPTGGRVWTDQLVFCTGAPNDSYFDGDTPDTPTMRYDWWSTPHGSSSTATPIVSGVWDGAKVLESRATVGMI